MAKKRKKPSAGGSGALLKNHIYKDFGGGKQSKTARRRAGAQRSREEHQTSMDAMTKGQQMARIEAYAREHGISITQAMTRLMS